MEIRVKDINDVPRAAAEFIKGMGDHHIFAFYGEMGAGKTTFISEICRQLGVDETSGSPSFSIANEYETERGIIYHFDFYRLESVKEALEIGVEDYFDSGALCFIEWPEMIGNLLPDEAVKVTIEEDSLSGGRSVCVAG